MDRCLPQLPVNFLVSPIPSALGGMIKIVKAAFLAFLSKPAFQRRSFDSSKASSSTSRGIQKKNGGHSIFSEIS